MNPGCRQDGRVTLRSFSSENSSRSDQADCSSAPTGQPATDQPSERRAICRAYGSQHTIVEVSPKPDFSCCIPPRFTLHAVNPQADTRSRIQQRPEPRIVFLRRLLDCLKHPAAKSGEIAGGPASHKVAVNNNLLIGVFGTRRLYVIPYGSPARGLSALQDTR